MPPRSKSTGGKGAKPPPQPAPTFDARTRWLDQLTDIYHALDSDGTGKVAWLKLRPTLARGGLSSTEITKFKQSMAEQGAIDSNGLVDFERVLSFLRSGLPPGTAGSRPSSQHDQPPQLSPPGALHPSDEGVRVEGLLQSEVGVWAWDGIGERDAVVAELVAEAEGRAFKPV